MFGSGGVLALTAVSTLQMSSSSVGGGGVGDDGNDDGSSTPHPPPHRQIFLGWLRCPGTNLNPYTINEEALDGSALV